jgi:PBP1b-binding outer membrane lipoprotein LpoB
MKISAIAAVLILALTLSGCATLQLGDNATSAEKKAALCLDAQSGMAMADAALAAIPEAGASEYVLYWNAFRAGALIGINSYCVAPSTK